MGFYLDWSAITVIVILALLFTISWKTVLLLVRGVKAILDLQSHDRISRQLRHGR